MVLRRALPYAVSAVTSPRTRSLRRRLQELARRAQRAPHRILYLHQLDDPYAQLVAQLLPELLRRYDVALEPRVAPPPPDWAAPERAQLLAWSRRDAADVAPHLGLAFADPSRQPDAAQLARAERILLAASADPVLFAEHAARLGAALWSGDEAQQDAIERELGAAGAEHTRAALSEAAALRARRGHYLGATFHYAGEWYWGVDRLHLLEERLAELGARRPGMPAAPLVALPRTRALRTPASPATTGPELEFFLSLRSPYTYLAMERCFALARRHGARLVLRPVLPMVMRGLAVPRAKQLYILFDARREAEALGIPFGRICDPLGAATERGLALLAWARERGAGEAFLLSFGRAVWAEGVDATRDAGLRRIVLRAGLPWEEARTRLGDEKWREEAEANRRALRDLGLWGVPSFRVGDWSSWGQDRLWRVDQELGLAAQRVGAVRA